MDEPMRYLRGESDSFVGQRRRLARYLVCALQGYFPVAVQTGPNRLAAILRTGATHVGISGTLAVTTSDDGGCAWSDPVEIAPRWDDNRNPALGVNAAGELIAAFWRARLQAYAGDAHGLHYDAAAAAHVPDAALFVGCSADGGRAWGEFALHRSTLLSLASPYGRIIRAADGVLLMGIYGRPRQPVAGTRDVSVLLRSYDDGRTWGDETLVAAGYNETSYLALPDGRLLAAARSESGYVATLTSDDAGRTWSAPHPLTREDEHPADLTLLHSGRVLLTFGRRIRPLGCGALLSEDGGATWRTDREVLLAGDGVLNTDLGYPSTVQLDDGHIVTLLYYASGSQMNAMPQDWGQVSCQAIHYREEDIL